MALSDGQKADLARYAKETKEPSQVCVVIGKLMRPTREAGTGYPITVYLEYLSDGYHDLPMGISRCQSEYTAVAKAQEIGRYLRDELGIKNVRVMRK